MAINIPSLGPSRRPAWPAASQQAQPGYQQQYGQPAAPAPAYSTAPGYQPGQQQQYYQPGYQPTPPTGYQQHMVNLGNIPNLKPIIGHPGWPTCVAASWSTFLQQASASLDLKRKRPRLLPAPVAGYTPTQPQTQQFPQNVPPQQQQQQQYYYPPQVPFISTFRG